MNKQLKKVLFALLAAGCVLSAAACTETKAVYAGGGGGSA